MLAAWCWWKAIWTRFSLRKYGVQGVVATLGTALTEEQARLMKRYAPEVWVSYDGDAAGQKAALRALDILEPTA